MSYHLNDKPIEVWQSEYDELLRERETLHKALELACKDLNRNHMLLNNDFGNECLMKAYLNIAEAGLRENEESEQIK